MTWKLVLTKTAISMLKSIGDRRLQQQIARRIDGLCLEPEKQGKPLLGELSGYRSLRAAGQRYRIIYRINNDRVEVLVISIGIRKEGSKTDVYSLAKKLIRLRLID